MRERFDRPLYSIKYPVQLLTTSTSCPTSCRTLLLLIRQRRPSSQSTSGLPPPPQSLPALAHWACANSVQIERYVSITYPLSRMLARIVLPNYTQLEIALGPAAKGAATI